MQWIKWTLIAAAGCLPAMAFAEEPPKPNNSAKIGLRIEVQTSDEKKPYVLVFGDDDSKDSKDGKVAAERVRDMIKQLQAQVEHGKKPHPGEARTFSFTARLHEGKKATFLGVTTSEPPTVLRKQLGLHDGMGLVVDSVMHESPAAKAGLQEYDVLQKIDDQVIVNLEQLTVLIRAHKSGDEVKLSVIHEGKPAVITAKLGEHELADLGEGRENEEVERAIRQLLPRAGWQINADTRSGRAQGGLKPGQAMPGAALNPGAPLNPAQIGQPRPTSKTVKEGDRSYTLTVSPWGQKVFVVNEKGKEIFEGAVNTPEQRAKVPAAMMDTLQKLEKEIMAGFTGAKPAHDVKIEKKTEEKK